MTALARLAAMRRPLDWRIGAYAAICGAPCRPLETRPVARLQYLAGYLAGQQMAAQQGSQQIDYLLQ